MWAERKGTMKTVSSMIKTKVVAIPQAALSVSVTSIGPAPFWICKALTSISIPETVTNIEAAGLWGCSTLTNITVSPLNPA